MQERSKKAMEEYLFSINETFNSVMATMKTYKAHPTWAISKLRADYKEAWLSALQDFDFHDRRVWNDAIKRKEERKAFGID